MLSEVLHSLILSLGLSLSLGLVDLVEDKGQMDFGSSGLFK